MDCNTMILLRQEERVKQMKAKIDLGRKGAKINRHKSTNTKMRYCRGQPMTR